MHYTWVRDQPVMHLCPSYQSGWMWFAWFRSCQTSIQLIFCRLWVMVVLYLVVILMQLCKERSHVCPHHHVDQKSGNFFLILMKFNAWLKKNLSLYPKSWISSIINKSYFSQTQIFQKFLDSTRKPVLTTDHSWLPSLLTSLIFIFTLSNSPGPPIYCILEIFYHHPASPIWTFFNVLFVDRFPFTTNTHKRFFFKKAAH